MNKPTISIQTYNKVFVPDLRSPIYDAAIARLLFLALNPFTGWFWAPLVFYWSQDKNNMRRIIIKER
jgi:hypothetical protein